MNDRLPQHVPVLTDEVMEWLAIQPGYRVVDGTFGSGGHTRRFAEAVQPGGQVLALDRDPVAFERADHFVRGLPVQVVQANYSDLPEVLRSLAWEAVDAILLDLGLSSVQLADSDRGFSFDSQGPLDLRFDPEQGRPAWQLISRLSEEHLAQILFQFGEERYARRIAAKLVQTRRQKPIRTAADLAQLVRRSVPKPRGPAARIDAATRTFQAFRIAVNEELKWLEVALRRFPECLRPGGRLAIISYHSLEDRPVKQSFRDEARYQVLTKRPIRPQETEVAANPRSRSAKMRVAQRSDDAVG